MSGTSGRVLRCGEAAPRREVPEVSLPEFRQALLDAVSAGGRLSALFGRPDADRVRLLAVLADPEAGTLSLLETVVGDRYPALTPDLPQAHLFEREIAEQWGVVPEGHPWLKPVRFHASYRPSRDAWGRTPGEEILPSVGRFLEADGEEVHEVAVGPVHAGVIEPGHFRFLCHGERVLHLEISLGYQHRGIERTFKGGPTMRTVHAVETLAGDTTAAHATAYAQALEALAGAIVPARGQAIRGIALELERLANHSGDLGALAGDIGYLPPSAHFGRIRGDFLNLTALACGSRFGRGWVRPGGSAFDLEPLRAESLSQRMETALRDAGIAAELLWDSSSAMARFEGTGTLARADAEALGVCGVAARACGISRDARYEFPAGIFRFSQIPVSTWHEGDVHARARVRWLEIQRSAEFLRGALSTLPEGPVRAPVGALAPSSIAVSLVEGWRGEIVHVAITGANGRVARYKVVDPSFRNWAGLALAMRGEPVSDFPLCNKSFNLSYAGFDL